VKNLVGGEVSGVGKAARIGAVVALGLGVGGYLAYREEIDFYVGVLRAYLTARRFYARYEHLARDVVFDPEMAPRLDVYSPAEGAGHPVLFFVHGGGWQSFDKVIHAPVARRLLPEGMVVVIPDYTLHPEAGYEQMAREVAAALRWTLENVEAYGGDPGRVVVAGHSAGAHLAGLALMDPRFLAAYGHSVSEICGFVGMSGVYDVQAEYDFWQAQGEHPRLIEEVMGGQQNFGQASPLRYVRRDLPPILLIHGDRDKTVPFSIATEFQAALEGAGAESELSVYAGQGHTDYLFAGLAEERSRLIAELAGFVRGCTAPAP
jgi:acetyl esterase/lipase